MPRLVWAEEPKIVSDLKSDLVSKKYYAVPMSN